MSRERSSIDSIREATENKSEFSRHGNAAGAAGVRDSGNIVVAKRDFLSETGQSRVFPFPNTGPDSLRITLAWNNVVMESKGFWGRLFGRVRKVGIDLDLGCLYELANGKRGSIQAFGGLYGALNEAPWIHHTGDERTGDTPGIDEALEMSGAHWSNVKRLLVYAYVYKGPTLWAQIKPEMRTQVPGSSPMIITPAILRADLPICALATVENMDGGVKLTNICEYFSSQPAMDRAFGYGIAWEDGRKE